jgi:hypothetical protein
MTFIIVGLEGKAKTTEDQLQSGVDFVTELISLGVLI